MTIDHYLRARDLLVSQSALGGENVAVEKILQPVDGQGALTELQNFAFHEGYMLLQVCQ